MVLLSTDYRNFFSNSIPNHLAKHGNAAAVEMVFVNEQSLISIKNPRKMVHPVFLWVCYDGAFWPESRCKTASCINRSLV